MSNPYRKPKVVDIIENPAALAALPQSAEDAQFIGARYYLSDRRCPENHAPALRYASTRRCVLCSLQRNRWVMFERAKTAWAKHKQRINDEQVQLLEEALMSDITQG